jgi:hypothetical protein
MLEGLCEVCASGYPGAGHRHRSAVADAQRRHVGRRSPVDAPNALRLGPLTTVIKTLQTLVGSRTSTVAMQTSLGPKAQNRCRTPRASTEGSAPDAVAFGVTLVLEDESPKRPTALLFNRAYDA